MNNCIWTTDVSGSISHGEIVYDSSTRIDQKRLCQWSTDASEKQLSSNKKQAIESVKETSEAAILNNFLFGDNSSSQSVGQVGDCLFGTKSAWDSNVSDKKGVSSDLTIEKKGIDFQFGNDPSMSQAVENPLCLNADFSKLKGNEVRIPENCLPEFHGTSCCRTVDHKLFPGPTYNNLDGNDESITGFSNIDGNFTSVGQASMASDVNLNQHYDGINNNLLSIDQSFNGLNGQIFSKGPENLFVVNPFYGKLNEIYMSADSSYNKGNLEALSLFSIGGQQDNHVASSENVCSKENSSILSMVPNCKKGKQTTISFGGFQDDQNESVSSGRLKSHDVLRNATSSRTDCSNRNKEQRTTKKLPSNNFPTNVKSLMSTGILDGVPVKYVSWAREKNLRAVVKGTGYLCGCQDCKLSKAINAYEFELHAGCKTKHPNNHIYFENGKTIYAVVQELKNTPQNMLFDVIQNVAGSPINQKNFHTWKASYQAATRELQRIYGTGELIVS